MQAFRSTQTQAERDAEQQRLADDALRSKLDVIRRARVNRQDVTYLVWDYSDIWHPFIDAAFTSRDAAEQYVKINPNDLSWSPLATSKTVAQSLAADDQED